MTGQEKAAVAAVIKALSTPRVRGRFTPDSKASEDMLALGMALGLPHGGHDTIDRAVMTLQAAAGFKIKSIVDK